MADTKPNSTMDENRIIFLSGEFNEDRAKEVITRIFTLEAKDPTKDIIMYIDSYGGYVHSFMAMHDIIKMSRCNIATVCIGKAMSCGQMLLISGTKGKRFSTQNSRVLLHEISSGAFGKLTDMEIDINESKSLQKIIEDLIIKYTKITKNKLKDLMARDRYFSANEALELGIIDHIIKTPKDLYSKINI